VFGLCPLDTLLADVAVLVCMRFERWWCRGVRSRSGEVV
jgi:hypothetical protein